MLTVFVSSMQLEFQLSYFISLSITIINYYFLGGCYYNCKHIEVCERIMRTVIIIIIIYLFKFIIIVAHDLG